MRAAQRRQISLVFGWSSMPDYWRSRVPARNREIRTPRVGRSHFGGGGSGSRSAVPTYPQPPHKWTTSPDSGPHWRELAGKPQHRIPTLGGRSVPSPGSFRTSIEWPCPSRPCWIDSPAGFPESGRDIAGVAGTTLRLRDCPGASCLGITTTPLAPRTRKALVSKQPGPSRISYFALPALAFGQPARQALTA